MASPRAPRWRSPDVLAIALSAFFADFGYQAVLAGFPLFLVLFLHAPVWAYGLATALSYGGGAVVAYLGGLIGDRTGHRRLALIGNALIPLLSLSALVPAAGPAVLLLTLGWWARNLRTPSRRAMLARVVAPEDQGAAFGFLHALDIGGAVLAALWVLIAVLSHVAWRWVFLATALPLAASTYALSRTRRLPEPAAEAAAEAPAGAPRAAVGFRSLLLATALFGFSSYSVGFPILTVAQGLRAPAAGVAAFLVLQAVSAATGYIGGPRLGRTLAGRFRNLGLLGYLGAGLASALLAVGYGLGLGLVGLLPGIALLGFALAVVETLEPALITVIRPHGTAGQGFGALSAARATGLFIANLALGLLYTMGAEYAYGYAALIACVAALIVFWALPAVRRAAVAAA